MKSFAWLLLLLAIQCVHAAPPHLDLEVRLDPHTRAFQGKADLTTTQAPDLSLDPLFKVSRVTLNGIERPIGRTPRPSAASNKPQRWRIEYSGTLPALPAGDQRGSPNPAGLFASPEGSFLAPSGAWYPDPGVPFTYRLTLSLPVGQKGLAPGNQKRVSESGPRYEAVYDFAYPAEGVWVMAGPYEVTQQSLMLEDGKRVTVRTWFHSELTGIAGGYLEDSVRYIQRYSRLIGNYPFADFSIVASPLSHGLGIPSLTYLGRSVLRLPFIRATSLGHEVLHNWWGNGVYPDWPRGNWSEGLTTFMADYAFREDQSDEAAREMRLNWLRDLAAVPATDETALAEFKSRHHGISSVVGYAKSAMVFLMLRDEIGRAAFHQGLRLFWQRHQFKTAGWKDLEAAFAEASRRDLSRFFAQWVYRASSARLVLAPAGAEGKAAFKLVQHGEAYDMLVPLRIRSASGESQDLGVRVRDRETVVDLVPAPMPAKGGQVELDPDLRLWRRLDPRDVPPIFREVFISPRSELFLAGKRAEWQAPATALANRLLDAQAREVSETDLLSSPQVPALVIGDADSIGGLLSRLGLAGVPEVVAQASQSDPPAPRRLKGSARAWTARAANGKTYAFVTADNAEALAALQRAMPHYGRQSWLVFQDGRVIEQGAWPVTPQILSLER
jgi:aminopeptidase N